MLRNACDFRRQVIVLNNCFTKGGKVIRSKVEPYFVNLAEFPNVHFWLLPQKIRGLAAVPVWPLQFSHFQQRPHRCSLPVHVLRQAHGDLRADGGRADHHDRRRRAVPPRDDEVAEERRRRLQRAAHGLGRPRRANGRDFCASSFYHIRNLQPQALMGYPHVFSGAEGRQRREPRRHPSWDQSPRSIRRAAGRGALGPGGLPVGVPSPVFARPDSAKLSAHFTAASTNAHACALLCVVSG